MSNISKYPIPFDCDAELRKMRLDLITGKENVFIPYMRWVDELFKMMTIKYSVGIPDNESVFYIDDTWMFRTDHYNMPTRIILWYNINSFPEIVNKEFGLDEVECHLSEYVADMTYMVLKILIENNPDVKLYDIFDMSIILLGGYSMKYTVE